MKKFTALICIILILSMLLTGCASPEPEQTPEPTPEPIPVDATGRYALSKSGEATVSDIAFYSDYRTDDNCRVFYEIFVGSFSDSDGDGIGDLRGIIDRFDYLNDGDPTSGLSLGIEGIWLTPIFKSPTYHKYDVSDYYTIDPRFGTEDDLKELIALCHERNVKIIIDLPINHTGALNEWFAKFRRAHRDGDTESEYYDFYSWYDGDKETAPAGRSYQQISGTNHKYECNFSGDMPELNFDNDFVRQTVLELAKYYLDMGIDGFRFDAAKYIYYGDNEKSAEFWAWYIPELKKINPDVYTVAEVWDGDGITDRYYPYMNCFDFTTSQVNGLIAETAKAGNVNKYTAYVENYISRVTAMREDAMIVPFITNHDMDRAAGFLTAASGQMKVAANLYLLSPGSPFIYYGEEIGIRGSRGGANTDANRRLAMLWGDGDTVKDPEGSSYGASNQTDSTVALQLGDGDSLYNYYKRLIMIRAANPEIARGEYEALNIPDSKLGGFVSTWNGSSVLVIHNTTISEKTLDLAKITELPFDTLAAVIGVGSETVYLALSSDLDPHPKIIGAHLDGTKLTIDAQTSVVLRISGGRNL